MVSDGVRGADQLKELGAALKGADKDIKREMLRGFREAGKPLVKDVKAGILATFPNKGGLADRVAKSSIGVRTRLTGKSAGVRVQAVGKQGRSVTTRSLRSMDAAGSWRHPIYPIPSRPRKTWKWKEQSSGAVEGWFTEETENHADDIRADLVKAMNRAADRIVSGI